MSISITIIIIAITAITSIKAFNDSNLYRNFIFAPYYMHRNDGYHRFFTYGLLHGDWTHLIFNMFAFYSFGGLVENAFAQIYPTWGKMMYILLYLTALPLSSIVDYFNQKNNSSYLAVGASGAVSAVIFSSILLFPTSGIMIFPIPFQIPAYIFGPLYLVFCVYMAKNANDNIGHLAHFFGALYGLIFTILTVKNVIPHFIQQVF